MAATYPIVKFDLLGNTVMFQDKDVIEAEVTQEIHPIGIEVPASNARVRVFLDNTTRDPIRLLLSMAGTLAVRGYYDQCGLHNGKPCFRQDVLTPNLPCYIVWVNEFSAWCITSESQDVSDDEIFGKAFYYSYDDVATPALVTTWVEGDGTTPLPVVSYVSGGLSIRDKFSPFSDSEYYQALSEGLAVDIFESVDGVEVAIGRFYLEEWNNPKEGELELVCTDAVGVLENKTYLGNFFETPTLVSAVVNDILDGTGLLYDIDTTTANKLVKGYIPGNISIREALQQVLFAAGAYVLSTGTPVLKIRRAIIPESDFTGGDIDITITDAEKTDSQSLNILQIVTDVEVVSHDYSKGQNVTEEIFSAFLPAGDHLIIYPKPYWQVIATGVGDALTYLATTNNEVLVSPDSGTYPNVTIYTIYGEFDFGANYVYLHVPEPGGEVTITGKPWVDANQVFSWTNPNRASAQPNVWSIDNATLLPSIQTSTEVTAAEALSRVASYAALRYLQAVRLFPKTIELGNVALVDSLYGKDVVGIVEKMSSDLTGGYLINAEIVGTEHSA